MIRNLVRVLLLALLAACNGTTLPEDDPYIRGTIHDSSHSWGILVEAARGSGSEEPRAHVRVGNGTEIRYRDGTPASARDLTQGRHVSVWITGTVLESLPPQVFARTVIIEPDPMVRVDR